MSIDSAFAVSGCHRDGRSIGPHCYHDPDIAERVARLLQMCGYEVMVQEVPAAPAEVEAAAVC